MQSKGRGGGRSNKKKNKAEYFRKQQQTQKRGQEIKGGLVGFLVTCEQNKEKRCVKELFNVLNDFTDKVYPDLDHDELFAEHERRVEAERVAAQKRKEEYLR